MGWIIELTDGSCYISTASSAKELRRFQSSDVNSEKFEKSALEIYRFKMKEVYKKDRKNVAIGAPVTFFADNGFDATEIRVLHDEHLYPNKGIDAFVFAAFVAGVIGVFAVDKYSFLYEFRYYALVFFLTYAWTSYLRKSRPGKQFYLGHPLSSKVISALVKRKALFDHLNSMEY